MEEKEILIQEPANTKIPVFLMIISILLIVFGLVLDWAGTFDKQEPVNNTDTTDTINIPVNDNSNYLGTYINENEEKVVIKSFENNILICDFKISINSEIRELNNVEFSMTNLEGKTISSIDPNTEILIKLDKDKVSLTYGSITSIYEKQLEEKLNDENIEEFDDEDEEDFDDELNDINNNPDTDITKIEGDENNIFTLPDEE